MYTISSPSLEKAGDGQAMAYRAGGEFIDMEMMQFHPTGLLVGKSMATGGLLEEGLRGAGARLFNAQGERFMEAMPRTSSSAAPATSSRAPAIWKSWPAGARLAAAFFSMPRTSARSSSWTTSTAW